MGKIINLINSIMRCRLFYQVSLLQKSERIRFLPEPVLSVNTKIPRFARNDKSEGVEMTKWLVYCHFEAWSAEKSSKVGVLQEPQVTERRFRDYAMKEEIKKAA
ncbi:MAG: hypothetical protein LRZ90_02835 [Thermodesulfovibrionales bacterium]|nr:hypothetical protein [Thermodesulfovibrionales bacterium]